DSGIDGDKRWIVKLDSLGNIVNEKFYSGVDDLFTFGGDQIFQMNNKFYVIGAGNPSSTLFPETIGFGGTYDGAIATYNDNLEFINLRLFGGESTDFLKRSVVDAFGNIYFLGVSKSLTGNLNDNYNNGETLDYWLFATDSNFNPLWSKNFGGSDPCGDLGCSNFSGNLVLKDNMLYAFIKNVVPETLPDYDIECGTLGVGNTDA
ncbi:MAG: hypothetical protein ACK4IY_08095, partial [Chitinophagales bacterium]